MLENEKLISSDEHCILDYSDKEWEELIRHTLEGSAL